MTLFSFSHLCLKFKFVVDVNNIGGSCRESVSSELQRDECWHKIWARIGRNFFFFWQNEPGDLSDHSTGGFWLYTAEGRYEYLVGVQRSQLSLQTAIPSSHPTLSKCWDLTFNTSHPIWNSVPRSNGHWLAQGFCPISLGGCIKGGQIGCGRLHLLSLWRIHHLEVTGLGKTVVCTMSSQPHVPHDRETSSQSQS